MGYFSNVMVTYEAYDHCEMPPELPLLWRLEELEARYSELSNRNDNCACFSEEELRYVLPKHFLSAADVRKAMELTTRELWERCGIQLRKEKEIAADSSHRQLCFPEVLSLQMQAAILSVA